MKRLLLLFLLVCGLLQGEEPSISRGGLTEALFILHNKHTELSDYLLRLKKMVSHCMLVYKGQKKSDQLTKELSLYQCSCKKKLLSASIKELELLLKEMDDVLVTLSKKEQFTRSFVQSHVNRALLIKRKIDVESRLIEHLLKMNQEKGSLQHTQKSLEFCTQKIEEFRKSAQVVPRFSQSVRHIERRIIFLNKVLCRVHADLERSQKTLKALQARLSTIDKELYKEEFEKRTNPLLEDFS